MNSATYIHYKKLAKIVLVNASILIVLLLILELYFQFIEPYDLYKRTKPEQISDKTFIPGQVKVNWMKADSLLGWVCADSSNLKFTNQIYNDPSISYHINNQGFRSNFDYKSETHLKNKKIMFLGDSFLFGVYLDYKETFIGQLELITKKYEYYNFGIPGYGADQMFLNYRKYFNLINPDMIVVVYIDDDISRILESYRFVEGLNKPSFKLCSEEFEYREASESHILVDLFENSYVLNKFYQKYLDYLAVSYTKKLIKQIRQTSRREVILIRWPRKEMLYWRKIDWYYNLSNFCQDNDIIYINLAEYFESLSFNEVQSLYLENDGHPSKEGNRLAAKILNRVIMRIQDNEI